MSGRPLAENPVLGPVLADVRGRGPEYRRWWGRQPGPESELTAPWSDGDEERVAQLGSPDPWWLRSVADELERVRRDVHDVGVALARIADAAIGGPAAAVCARLAASSHERASEAGALAVNVRDSGDKVEEVLDTLVRRVTRVTDVQQADAQPAPWREPPPSQPNQPGSDDRFEGYIAVLRAVRAELAAAIEQLPALVLGHPEELWPPEPWARELRASEPWAPEPWAPEPGAWRPEPGVGPLMPDTQARRVEPGYGVRIARLPDQP